nr:hypothetical protein [uncultured Prevotella sp.]
MEIGFLAIMVGLFIIMATAVSLLNQGKDSKCGNCKNFIKTPGSKHIGKCPIRHIVLDYEEACSHHKGKTPKNIQE